ncbi:MAG: 4Fe-4S binding protein [Rikenellaceae bacterium]
MWLGVGFELMDYEIFSAFIISSASTAVLVMAALFLILSLFIQKPYCRFGCPTGALITMAQKTK